MSNKKSSSLVSTLRFPEFREAGEWEGKMLGEICKFVRGPFGGTLKKEIFIKEGYAVYEQSHAISQCFDHFRYYIDEDKYKELQRFAVLPDDLIMSCSGTMGKFAIIPNKPKAGVINQALLKLTIKNKYDLNFIKYTLELPVNQEQLLSQSAGGAIKNVASVDQIKEIVLYMPNTAEQQKIAACLSSLDELITAHSQKLNALKKHKKGLMQQLFPAEGETVPTLRFPEFREAGEWVVVKIGDFVESYRGGAPLTPSDFVSYSDYEVIPKKAIDEGMYLNMSIEKPTYCKGSFYNKNLQSIVDSTYLITTLRDLVPSGPNIGYIVKYEGERKYILAQGVYGIKLNKKIISDFLIQFSKTDKYRKMMQSVMVGTTQVHIRNSVYFNLPISVPTLPEQQKIAACLSSLDELITAQSQKLDALKKHKKGLMQQLFPAVEE